MKKLLKCSSIFTCILISNQLSASSNWKSAGSGFAINPQGYIVTNHHVVKSCSRLDVKSSIWNGKAKLIAVDKINDLAVIKVRTTAKTRAVSRSSSQESIFSQSNPSIENLNSFLTENKPSTGLQTMEQSALLGDYVQLVNKPVKAGEQINVMGFPYADIYSKQMKITTGTVVATVGINNNSSRIQIDAATNPGNSGGAIVNQKGELVAVHVEGIKIAKQSVAQGMNFSIKSGVLEAFLKSHNVAYSLAPNNNAVITSDKIYDQGKNYVVFIKCN